MTIKNFKINYNANNRKNESNDLRYQKTFLKFYLSLIERDNKNGRTLMYRGSDNYKISLDYYIVKAKTGHQRNSEYTLVEFPTIARTAREAAMIARYKPRVKHDQKDAIIEVRKVEEKEFEKASYKNENNAYLHCKNIQEQREKCGKDNVVYKEHNNKKKQVWDKNYTRKDRIDYQMKKNKNYLRSVKEKMNDYSWE